MFSLRQLIPALGLDRAAYGKVLGMGVGGLSALFLGALAWVAVGMAGFVQVAVALEPGSERDCASESHTRFWLSVWE